MDEASDVSSNELSGPEDGECESGNGEFSVKLFKSYSDLLSFKKRKK